MAEDNDNIFLPDIEPEDIGWPRTDFYRELQWAEADARYALIGDEFDDEFAGDFDGNDYRRQIDDFDF